MAMEYGVYSARMVDRSSDGTFPYIYIKFYCVWMPGFVSLNQETHGAFPCKVPIFIHSIFADKFKN